MSEPTVTRKLRQRAQMILALLQQPGLEKAAAIVGISTATAWRISKTPEFQEAYRQARRDAFTQTLGRLQQAAGAATSTLMKIMVDATAPAGGRVRAADCVLEHAASALDLEDVQVRLVRLEQIEKDREEEDQSNRELAA